MDEEYKTNRSTSRSSRYYSTLLSVSDSSDSRYEFLEVSSVDSTSITDDLLGNVAQVHDKMETGMKDNAIQWRKDYSFKI